MPMDRGRARGRIISLRRFSFPFWPVRVYRYGQFCPWGFATMPGILSDILKPWNIVRRIKRTHEAIEELHIRFTSLEQRLERIENYGSSAFVQMEADRIASLFLTGQVAARG